MPIEQRAKQFAPFSALKGLEEALRQKEELREPRRELSEEAAAALNETLLCLREGQTVRVQYYDTRRYVQQTGTVTRLWMTQRTFWVEDVRIDFRDIHTLEIK